MHNGLQRMLDDIVAEVGYTHRETGRESLDSRVMAAMASVPRDAFVPEDLKPAAFDNGPLPIGHGQTISQPYIVALMTDMLAPQPEHSVLEIGTGSGYQTAILSRLCRQVYSVELVEALSEASARRFAELGFANIELRTGDGYQGWPEHAPYDGIIVTAAAGHIPEALIDQLRAGGNMAIPVGPRAGVQDLVLISKDAAGDVHTRSVLPVAFVPLIEAGTQRGRI